MAEVIGGLRDRFVRDSFKVMLEDALDALGWFDAGRQHRPVQILGKPLDWNEPLEPNLIGVGTKQSEGEDVELGSRLVAMDTPFLVDLLAESESLGVDLSNDIFDILRGKHEDAGRTRPTFTVYDFRPDTPTAIGYCTVSEPLIAKTPTRVERAWLQHWYVIGCIVTDSYTDDETEI